MGEGLSKCNNKCMYYRIINKERKFKGFCDYFGVFFEELTPEQLKERTESCEEAKKYPTNTGI